MYGMGWMIRPKVSGENFCREEDFCAFHTGGAVGASSILLILPKEPQNGNSDQQQQPPKGVVVAILCNMQGVGMSELAYKIAQEFKGLGANAPYRVQKVYQC